MSITDSETRVASYVHHGARPPAHKSAGSTERAGGQWESEESFRRPRWHHAGFTTIPAQPLQPHPSTQTTILAQGLPGSPLGAPYVGLAQKQKGAAMPSSRALGPRPAGLCDGIRRGALGCPSAPLGRHPRGVPNKPRGRRVTDQLDSSTRDFSLIRRFPVGKTHATPNASDCRLEPSDG
jgi:hypothetical protein